MTGRRYFGGYGRHVLTLGDERNESRDVMNLLNHELHPTRISPNYVGRHQIMCRITESDMLDHEREEFSRWDTCCECGWAAQVIDLVYHGDFMCWTCYYREGYPE